MDAEEEDFYLLPHLILLLFHPTTSLSFLSFTSQPASVVCYDHFKAGSLLYQTQGRPYFLSPLSSHKQPTKQPRILSQPLVKMFINQVLVLRLLQGFLALIGMALGATGKLDPLPFTHLKGKQLHLSVFC